MSQIVPAVGRRWLTGIVVALPIAAITAFVVWSNFTPIYTATAILRVASTESRLLFETAENKPASPNAFEIFKRSQRQWMLSRFVLIRALRDTADLERLAVFRNEADPADWLEANLSVTFPDESEVMHVSLSGHNPEGLDRLVNAVVKAYFDEIINEEGDRKRERLSGLELAYRQADTELRAKRNDLRMLVERVGTGDSTALTFVQQNSLNQFAAFQQQYAKVRFEMMQAEGELEAAQHAPDAEIEMRLSDRELRLALRTDPMARRISAERTKIRDRVQALPVQAHEDVADPKQAEFERRLAISEERYQARKTELRQELIEDKREAAAAEIDSLKQKIKLLTALEAQLKRKSGELEAAAKQIGKSSIDVEMMRMEIAAVQDVVSRLSTELERTRVEMQSDARTGGGSRVVLKSEAHSTHKADSKIRLPATVGAGLGSLLFALLFVVWLISPRPRIKP